MISINEVQDEVIAEFNDFDDWMDRDRKSTRLNSSHLNESRMPSSA